MKTGGGFLGLEEERHKSGVDDMYITKIDQIIKDDLGKIRQLRKKREGIEVEIAEIKM